MDLEKQFSRYGFIHVKGVLDRGETARLRRHLFGMYDAAETRSGQKIRGLGPHVSYNTPEIYRLPFLEPIVRSLEAILEPRYTMLPDLTVSKNQVGLSAGRKNPGWHWDSSSEGKRAYLYDPGYRFVKCGLYLQENSEDYGGGVDIVPGRHRWPLKTGSVNLNYKAKNLLDIIGTRFRGTMVKLEPGDFLAFDFCLPHRSTLPRKLLAGVTAEDLRLNAIDSIPRDKTKFVVYWDACRAVSLDGYWNNNKRRAEEEELANPDAIRFHASEAVAMSFPDDYDEDFIRLAEDTGIKMASFEKGVAADFRRRYEARLAGAAPMGSRAD